MGTYCREQGIFRAWKCEEKSITLGFYLLAAPFLESCTEELSVIRQDSCVLSITKLLKQARGALYVCKEERDGAGWQSAHALTVLYGPSGYLHGHNRPLG